MIDEEVETVLREIRERVISQPPARESLSEPAPGGANGNQTSQLFPTTETSARNVEALARLNAHLTTTARAWDRLPPVFSNRSGTAARIEVWIKARLRVFSRWFTWEQVNFNAAVHHALGETLRMLTEQDAAIASIAAISTQLEKNAGENARENARENAALRLEIETLRDEIDALRTQLQADAASRKIESQNQQRETNAWQAEVRGELEALRIQAENQRAELRVTIENAASELRDREDRVENEQRVCFQQLSLETNEITVSNERAQQRIHKLLEEMNERIKLLEDSAKQKPRS
jgi:hypothetical protein